MLNVGVFPNDALEFFARSITKIKEKRKRDTPTVRKTFSMMEPKNIIHSVSPREKFFM